LKPPLTKAQEEVLTYFKKFFEVNEVRTPTIREICSGKIDGERIIKERKSSASGYLLVRHLVAKGYLEEHLYRSVPYWKLANDQQA